MPVRLFGIAILVVILLGSCAGFHASLDQSGLETLREKVMEDFSPGRPEQLDAYLAELSLREDTRPPAEYHYSRSPLETWSLQKYFDEPLRQERIVFESPFDTAYPRVNRGIFYSYRLPQREARGTIVFLPGLGVSDFAFRFIRTLFRTILEQGWDLAVYIPPFHMERGCDEEDCQYNLFTADITRNTDYYIAMVEETRIVMDILRQDGVTTFGGWGGSIGAAVLLGAEQSEEFDHLALMIPIIDWNTVLQNETCMDGCTDALLAAGFSREQMTAAYNRISPVIFPLRTPSDRILVQAARHDQLTPVAAIRSYTRVNAIRDFFVYNKGHATILLDRGVYTDYADFLQGLPGP